MDKLDISVLPNGFLIENKILGWHLSKVGIVSRDYYIYRPALDIWHFNDGSMVLPDGLVVDVVYCDRNQTVWSKLLTKGGQDIMSKVGNDKAIHSLAWHRLVAVKILGVTPSHAEEGERLGMEVVEV